MVNKQLIGVTQNSLWLTLSELVLLNVYGAQESMPKHQFRHAAYVAWRAGTITLFLLGA